MVDPDPTRVPIGALRWAVTIAQRVQTASTTTTGITEGYTAIAYVRADIQPIGAMTFYAGEQVDTPVTHRVRLRWLDWLDTTYVLQRQMHRLDGSVRTELFRIRRVKEVDGRRRFIELECELEKRT